MGISELKLPAAVKAHELADAKALMERYNITGFPVVDAAGRVNIARTRRVDRVSHGHVERDAEAQVGAEFAQSLRCQAVAKQQVMRGVE